MGKKNEIKGEDVTPPWVARRTHLATWHGKYYGPVRVGFGSPRTTTTRTGNGGMFLINYPGKNGQVTMQLQHKSPGGSRLKGGKLTSVRKCIWPS